MEPPRSPHPRFRRWGRSRGNRLPRALYPPGHPVHVILCTRAGEPVFAEPEPARILIDLLEEHPATRAACLLPDHLHWLLSDAATMASVVGQFKSYSAWKLAREGRATRLWQRSYWDHVIRRHESLEVVIDYIRANPVRAGLAATPDEYPWTVVKMGEEGG